MKKLINRFSENYNSVSIEQLMKKIEQFDCISFDLFDTLLKRDVEKPIDVFMFMEKNLGISGFCKERVRAEQHARNTKSGEVTIEEIYKHVAISGVDSEYLIAQEKKYEISLSYRNEDIYNVYQECIKTKNVILVSDMYLDRQTIEKILKKNEIFGYSRLYISNEINLTKADGGLYDFVLKDMKISRKHILHIGNSFKADYLSAKKRGIASVKVATYMPRTLRDYRNLLGGDNFNWNTLNAYVNNHTPGNSDYIDFGYERFGPLLYGFTKWLFEEIQQAKANTVFFLARDGFIMQKAYKLLKYDSVIPSVYFEASRRSLRVPSYTQSMGYNDFLKELTVPNMTSLTQIFDSLGLDIGEYHDLIKRYNFMPETMFKRDALKFNEEFKRLYLEIEEDIKENANRERRNLVAYLRKYDFSKKIAIVDIGWGGSMQRYLEKTLDELGVEHDIVGFYFGLTQKAYINLGENNLKAKAYLFDCLNDPESFDMERPFVGLFETLFLEQNGSVKRYICNGDDVEVERYPYEYSGKNGMKNEIKCVQEIQKGALAFIKEYSESIVSEIVGSDSKIMFSNIYLTGVKPNMSDVAMFGRVTFFNDGRKVYLARPKSFFYYFMHLKELKSDLYDAQWKIGFLKGLFKFPVSYMKIYEILKKIAN